MSCKPELAVNKYVEIFPAVLLLIIFNGSEWFDKLKVVTPTILTLSKFVWPSTSKS